jgi:hypothetical protein
MLFGRKNMKQVNQNGNEEKKCEISVSWEGEKYNYRRGRGIWFSNQAVNPL